MTDSRNGRRLRPLLADFPPPEPGEWREAAEALLEGAPFEKRLLTRTLEGITLQPIYHAGDAQGLAHLESLPRGAPGAWAVRQEIPYRDPDTFNRAARHDLERGQTELSLDLGDWGRGDLGAALEGIDLAAVPVFLHAWGAPGQARDLLAGVLEDRGLDPRMFRGGIEADPLGAEVRGGAASWDGGTRSQVYDRLAEVLTWARNRAPHLQVVNVHGHPYHDGGGSAVEELGFVMATVVEYLREMDARACGPREVIPHLGLSLSIGSHFFMEVAKLRAARLLWARVATAFGVGAGTGPDGDPIPIPIHGRTSRFNRTVYDPHVNLLRGTTEAFAGAVGGVDSLHVAPFDEALGLPDDFSRRIARNTQLVLQEEAHLTRVADPAGGSWYVERLTDQVAREAWALLQEVEGMGGMARALEAGFPQGRVADTARTRRERVETRKDVLVGVNMYANPGEKAPPAGASTAAPPSAGGGETAAFSSIDPIPLRRLAEPFQEIRRTMDAHVARSGSRPAVFLANLGPVPRHRARADFSTGFMEVGGFDVLGNLGFETPEAAARAAAESGAPVTVICSMDEDYPNAVPPLIATLRELNPEAVVLLAGHPPDHVAALREAGVDEFIHVRANAWAIHTWLQERLGIAAGPDTPPTDADADRAPGGQEDR